MIPNLVALIKNHPQGLTLPEIKSKLKFKQVSKDLARLVGLGKVKRIGNKFYA